MENITLDMTTEKYRECVYSRIYSLVRFNERYKAYMNEQKGRKEKETGKA